MSDRIDREHSVREAIRMGRIIWRHTPPLRSAAERDDWLQDCALCALKLDSPGRDDIKRALRALAMRIVRDDTHSPHFQPLLHPQDPLPRHQPPETRVPMRLDKRSPRAARFHRRARIMRKYMKLTPANVFLLRLKRYTNREIARRFGVSVRTVQRYAAKARTCRPNSHV